MRKFSVRVNPEQSRELQELALENGYSWESGLGAVIRLRGRCMEFDNGIMTITPVGCENYTLVSFEDAQKLIKGEDMFKPTHILRDGEGFTAGGWSNYNDQKCVIVAEGEDGKHCVKTEPGFLYIVNESNLKPIQETKTITIDGKDIEISVESFDELKKQLLGE